MLSLKQREIVGTQAPCPQKTGPNATGLTQRCMEGIKYIGSWQSRMERHLAQLCCGECVSEVARKVAMIFRSLLPQLFG